MFDPRMLLAATQIIVESLPISSSGHVMLVSLVLLQCGVMPWAGMPGYFDDFLHGPTAVIIALYFYDAWSVLLRRMFTVACAWIKNGCSYAALHDSHKRLIVLLGRIAAFVAIADLVTAVSYGIIKGLLKDVLFLQSTPVLACGFGITGLMLYSTRWCPTDQSFLRLSCTRSCIIGLVQGLAALPGISRFASTVTVARWLGISPKRSLQFSFLLFFPLTVLAFLFKGVAKMLQHADAAQFVQPGWLGVYLVSSVAAYVLFALACRMVLRNQLWWFGLYMAIPLLSLLVL